MFPELYKFSKIFRNTILHPQWVANHFHKHSRRILGELKAYRILDIGSGDTDYAQILDSTNEVIRLDYPETNFRYKRPPDIYGTACDLPFADESMDVVLLLEVLEHIDQDSRAIESIRKVLRRGGKTYLSVPFLYPVHDAPYDFRRYTIHGLRFMLKRHGFRIVTEIRHGNSVVTAIQLLNLSLLEPVRNMLRSSKLAGLVLLSLFYPVCLLMNFVALPFMYLKWESALCLGHFIIAVRASEAE